MKLCPIESQVMEGEFVFGPRCRGDSPRPSARRALSVILVGCLLAVAPRSSRASELVTVWNDLALQAIRYGSVPPPIAVRQMAIVHLAIYDATSGIEPHYEPFLVAKTPAKEC